ncbi:MAG: hypothetical protein SFY32_08795 [Bacteroidota bacterium]|nr:hypothetical protein [Bacteroidota bacterium]
MNQILVVNDEFILEEVNRILNIPTNNTDVFALNKDQVDILTTRANNVSNGNFITDEQSEQDLDKWLK